MAKIRAKPDAPKAPTPKAFKVEHRDGEPDTLSVARAFLAPDFRHGMAVEQILSSTIGKIDDPPDAVDYSGAVAEMGEKAASGDLAFASRMLAAQAVTLDNIFAETTRRMARNMGEYLNPAETYARIALKAQANCRATLEALAKLHQPREQTVRHVHVNEGGQAVIADQFHHHTGVEENGRSDGQPQATGAALPSAVTALPSPDPLGNGVPIACGQREPTLSDARREG